MSRDIKFTRQHLLAILAGFVVIIILDIVISAVTVFITYHVSRTVFLSEVINTFSKQPLATINWILKIVSFISPILGGIVVGWLVKEKGWLYGGLLGILLVFISN